MASTQLAMIVDMFRKKIDGVKRLASTRTW
jgi:hypothetical protein